MLKGMKVVLSAVLFAGLIALAYLAFVKLPVINQYRDCYGEAYSTLYESHIIARKAWTSEQVICGEYKQKILASQECFLNLDGQFRAATWEKNLLKRMAMRLAKGTKTMETVIAEHNKRCTYKATILEFDSNLGQWF